MDCRLPKRSKPKEVNLVDDITKDVSNIDLTTIIFEVNLVGEKVLPAIYAMTRRCSPPSN